LLLLCGLGNSGAAYRNTRHNMGFLAIERFSESSSMPMSRKLAGCLVGEGPSVLLATPVTFMNLSGGPVASLMKKRNIPPENLVLVHDDLDMEFGRLRLKWDGGDGGHKGVRSVTEALGTSEFLRLKIGIGRDPVLPPEEYVLSRFKPTEKDTLSASLDRACEAMEVIVAEGRERAMNLFNR